MRAKRINMNMVKHPTWPRFVVTLMYMTSVSLIFAAHIIRTGLGMTTPVLCRAGGYTCLVFYMGSKMVSCITFSNQSYLFIRVDGVLFSH
jgi:hypothetical protein